MLGENFQHNIDRRYRDYINEIILFRLKIAIIIGLILHFSILPILWYVYPVIFIDWFKIFLIVTGLLGAALMLCQLSSPKVKNFSPWGADIVSYINVISLCIFVFLTDGSASRYYQGVNLVLLFYPFVNPFYIGHMVCFYLLSMVCYDFSALVYHGKFDLTNFLFANYYMTATATILFFMSKFYGEQHRNAFVRQELLKESIEDISKAKEEVEQAEKALQQKAQELERSNRDLEQFAYIASHDLQEPLRMVASFCQKLETRYKEVLDQDARDYINFAVDGAKRMQALIDALLKYARVSKKDVEMVEVDLNKTLQTIVNDMGLVIKEKNATIKIDRLPVLMANPVQMYQLFQNFLTNALKFKGDRDPVVEVSARKTEQGWEFFVRDNGIGIDDNHFTKLFVIFQRLHERGKYPGTGIGLALCKKIVENSNGRVWLESKLGEGTTFYFTLNLTEVHA